MYLPSSCFQENGDGSLRTRLEMKMSLISADISCHAQTGFRHGTFFCGDSELRFLTGYVSMQEYATVAFFSLLGHRLSVPLRRCVQARRSALLRPPQATLACDVRHVPNVLRISEDSAAKCGRNLPEIDENQNFRGLWVR